MKSPYRNTYDTVIVGNGPPGDNLSDIVDAAKTVVRFDWTDHLKTASVGHRTTHWIVSDRKHLRTPTVKVAPETFNPSLKGLAELRQRPAKHGRWTTLGLYLVALRASEHPLKRVALVNPGKVRSYEKALIHDLEQSGMRVFNL